MPPPVFSYSLSTIQPTDSVKAYKEQEPIFGHPMLKHYALDPEYINLNNGSYGATPKSVLEAVNQLTLRIEANPDLFHRVELQPLFIVARQKIADLIGAKLDEVVLVSNASTGVNTVLRNFSWEEGDIIFSFTTSYGSISQTAQSIVDVPPYPTASVITLNFPNTHDHIIKVFKEHIQANPAKPNKKRVAIIDSIVSNPGVVLPWKEMVAMCKDEGIWSVIDAAHSIGQEVGINLTKAAPDFWISNCHKWLSAKRACAVLYVPERNQHLITTSIPTSAAYVSPADRKGPNLVDQFEWNGTIDFAPYLTVPDALEFRQWMGGEEKINVYCHNLALNGGQILAKTLGTHVMDPDGDLTLNMVNVSLPLPSSMPMTRKSNTSIRNKLLNSKAYSAHFYHNGGWWTRCSAQVWNELEDFEKIGKIWLKVCAEVREEFEKGLLEGGEEN